MNEQVLTTITSASSARVESSAPARASRPIITSLSTRFFGHPRLTKPTFCGRVSSVRFSCSASLGFSPGGEIVRFFDGMQSNYFNIFGRAVARRHGKPSRWLGASVLVRDHRHHERQQPVEENHSLRATLSVTEEICESRILEGKCLGNRPLSQSWQ